jgi:exoribonuclease R
MAAADIMLTGSIGVLRTMPAPEPGAVARLRKVAKGLGIKWPDGATVGTVIAGLDPAQPRSAAFLDEAAELLRGAAYTAFDGKGPEQAGHGAVAAPYAHVTAPLRRLVDRYATEVCLALSAGRQVDDWVRAALSDLPATMAATDRIANAAERGAIDLAEAVVLAGRVGQEFDATVLDLTPPRGDRPAGGVVALDDPPVRAKAEGKLKLGERVRVRLVEADPGRRLVRFQAV